MHSESNDGNDLLAVKTSVQKAVDLARSGGGPSLIVNDTYRWRGHSKSDRNRYRTPEEIEEWKQKDPILKFRDYCLKEKLLTEKEADKIKEQGYADIEEARVFAEASPEPKVETLEEGVYAP
jgi:pyruvate dehydrogenase E1 component alpha subunit